MKRKFNGSIDDTGPARKKRKISNIFEKLPGYPNFEHRNAPTVKTMNKDEFHSLFTIQDATPYSNQNTTPSSAIRI